MNEDILLDDFLFDAVVLFGKLEQIQFIGFELFDELLFRCFIGLEFSRDFLNEKVLLLMNLVCFLFEIVEIFSDLCVKLSRNEGRIYLF